MAQQMPNSGQKGNVPLVKSSQIDQIPNLAPEMKAKYKQGLAGLEQQLAKTQPGSPEYNEFENRIRNASVQLMTLLGKAGRPAGAAAPSQQAAAPPAQRPPTQQAPGMQQQGSQQGQQPPQMLPASRAELGSIKINFPPSVIPNGEQAMNQYRTQWLKKAAVALSRRDSARSKGSQLQKMLNSPQGNANAQQIQQEMEKLRTEMNTANSEWESLKQGNARYGQQAAAQQAAGNQPQPAPPAQQPADTSQRPASSQLQQTQSDQQQARTSMSPVQPQGGFPSQQQQSMPPTAQPTQQQQSTPQSATQPQSAQNFPQPQQRPGMTAQQIMQAQQNMMNAQQHHAGMPQSATQPQAPQQTQGPQRPQALSHQAAMSQASFARQDAAQQQQQQQQHPQQQQQAQMSNLSNGLSLNPPQSATNQTPPSAFAHAQVPQQVSSNTKFPIPKTLNLDPRTQNPVQGPPSRPTFANSGMMSQPGVQRANQFTLEGEGDRVLSKRKLDELVRQVTGSVDSAESGGGLTSDVEEAVLTLADDFVDNVVTSACRLAKLRGSQTLDIRDIQIVLERNYGIRIPGYGLDEVRTVRKFQPAEGWRNKMQAVQAGKVMGGNAGKDA